MSDQPVTADAWRQLQTDTPAFGELTARVIADSGVAIAIDHEGRRHVLLPVTSLAETFKDSRSRGITVVGRTLEVERQPERPFLDVCCTDPAGYEAFNAIANVLVERSAIGVPVADAARETLGRWRRFWGSAAAEGLSPEQVRGLFGELWFLLVWLLPHGTEQLDHWTGPTGSRHDFQWSGLSIEAKTTSSVRGHIHRVNGLDQLDKPDGGQLALFSLRVREEAGAANSLPELVDAVGRALRAEEARLAIFEARLTDAGYWPAHVDRYREIRIRVVDERLYDVRGAFPRLTGASFAGGLPHGIEGVEYDVNLETCRDLILHDAPTSFQPPSGA